MKHYLRLQFLTITGFIQLLGTIRVRMEYGYWLVIEIGPSKRAPVSLNKSSQDYLFTHPTEEPVPDRVCQGSAVSL
jgi:hypothetical protein